MLENIHEIIKSSDWRKITGVDVQFSVEEMPQNLENFG